MILTIGDLEYLNRYIEHCNHLGIEIRILQIQTTRDNPVVKNIDLMEGKLLGYDYASGSSFTSLFAEDMVEKDNEELIEFRQFDEKINNNGMIDNPEDIEKYVLVRERLIQNGINLEHLSAMLIMRVTDVTENFIKKQ